MTGSFAATAAAAAPESTPTFSALANSLPATSDKVTGRYTRSRTSIEVALAARNQAG